MKHSLEENLERGPTNKELKEELRMPINKIDKILDLTEGTMSLETPQYAQTKDFLPNE